MRPDSDRLIEYLTKAQEAFDTACQKILDGQMSLTVWLVKANRVGMKQKVAAACYEALTKCVMDAQATFNTAIQQPEAKISEKSRIILSQL